MVASPSLSQINYGRMHLAGHKRLMRFPYLKQAMCSVRVLALLDFSVPFIVEADALGVGLGAVLMQNGRPIAYFSQRLVVVEHKKWLTKILGYDFDVQYSLGLENKVADALSRMHCGVSFAAISIPHVLSIPDLQAHVVTDPTLSKIMKDLSTGQQCGGYSLVQGCIKF
ncbi:uncharacterized protein LOC133791484 [Humulus lupulus]|uniref:uncharacterized protein LOC133791484 n=1 Tax=Humulus lupulus TaxID=3486 RepID=UPI002B4011A0|nr:uncharacterized protein LOC133791484 [Humulus lupulus]